jgi:hypothetical protein
MRFLMFNVCVLACLGYLFTASPDQSFSSWLTGTSKTVVAGVDHVMQDGKENIQDHGLAETASDLIDDIKTEIMAPAPETNQLREEIKSLKAEVSSLHNLLEGLQPKAHSEVSTVDSENMIAPLPDHADVKPVELVEQDNPPVSDQDIANAFAELADADQDNMVDSRPDATTTSDQVRYMTPAERQQDLGKLMLDMQVFYLEKSGI